MEKPKTLLALKSMYRNWPAVLGYPMLISGMELMIKSAWLNQKAKNNYKITLSTIHDEMKKWVEDTNLPENYRFGHNQMAGITPKSQREEVLAIGLYNTLLLGKNSQGNVQSTAQMDGLGALNIIDYQIPVAKKGKDIGCMDMLGLAVTEDGSTCRPVVIELKGQAGDTEKTRRDCPHFALLEAWIYFILFYRNIHLYEAQLVKNGAFTGVNGKAIAWDQPIMAVMAPQQYWEYWDRSDKQRGYRGLEQFIDCCGFLGHLYSAGQLSGSLFSQGVKGISLDVAGISIQGLTDNFGKNKSRNDIWVDFDSLERINPIPPDKAPEAKAREVEKKLEMPVTLHWSEAGDKQQAGSRKSFAERERAKQVAFKNHSSFIASHEARQKGWYMKPVDYCFPLKHQDENLYSAIRTDALAFFKRKNISWHSLGRRHLLSSQAYCINFLFPFAKNPDALKALMQHVFKDIVEVLPIEDKMYVTFEWNGNKDYLNEHGAEKQRGEMATFPDAAFKFRDTNANVHIVLIEWKYTEKYAVENKAEGNSGKRRLDTYRDFIEDQDCPLDLTAFGANPDQQMKALFYEPFYQLMREQLLAREMETDSNADAQIVSVLHICPKDNRAYREKVTSPILAAMFPGKDVVAIWEKLVKTPIRFASTDPETLFQHFPADRFGRDMKSWAAYMAERYYPA